MLKDSFANYVIQTALDSAKPDQRQRLVDVLRPLLPAIRNTAYGKRIQSKIYKEPNSSPFSTIQVDPQPQQQYYMPLSPSYVDNVQLPFVTKQDQ
jgi:hypothetical protein